MNKKTQKKSIKSESKISKKAIFSEKEIVKAREFIQGQEGLRLRGYEDAAGVMTIGYGHTGDVDGKPITKDMLITKEKAEELYRKDFEIHSAPLKYVKVPLTINQKIALASFIYNFGGTKFIKSTLYKKLNAGDYKGAADEFDVWINTRTPGKRKSEPNIGLINRRKREKELFLTPDDE